MKKSEAVAHAAAVLFGSKGGRAKVPKGFAMLSEEERRALARKGLEAQPDRRKLRPCPQCGQEFGGRELVRHKKECPVNTGTGGPWAG